MLDVKSVAVPHFWKDRMWAASIHLGISLVIAGLAALLVFGLWYPYPYRELAGGRELFMLVVTVDVILGPAITLAIFDRRKPMRELRRDLALVGLIQLSALVYGLWTVSVARPVQLAFEFDRFRVVHAIDVPADMLAKSPQGLQPLPLTGPGLIAVRPFRGEAEKADATMLALGGIQLGFRPDLWEPYAQAKERVLKAATPIEELKRRFPQHSTQIDSAVAETGQPAAQVSYLPLVGRKVFWTVLLDTKTADILGYIALDPY